MSPLFWVNVPIHPSFDCGECEPPVRVRARSGCDKPKLHLSTANPRTSPHPAPGTIIARMPTLPELLVEILNERSRLERLIARVPEDQREAPVLPGGWSVKTTLAHVAAWEALTLARLDAVRTGKDPAIPPLRSDRDIDAFNAGLLAETAPRPYADIRKEFDRTHKKLVEEVSNMEDELFEREIRAAWSKRRPVWELIGANTCWHYPEHSEAIEKWLSTI